MAAHITGERVGDDRLSPGLTCQSYEVGHENNFIPVGYSRALWLLFV